MKNRDLGIPGGPGKGDVDRTTDVKKFKANLAEIPLNPSDKTGFTEVRPGRFRKTYNRPAPAPTPTPHSLLPASRAQRASLLGGVSEN
jgi:hypothetical protein